MDFGAKLNLMNCILNNQVRINKQNCVVKMCFGLTNFPQILEFCLIYSWCICLGFRIMVELFALFFWSQFLEHYGFNLIFLSFCYSCFLSCSLLFYFYFLFYFDLFLNIAWSFATPLANRKYLNVVQKKTDKQKMMTRLV